MMVEKKKKKNQQPYTEGYQSHNPLNIHYEC